MREFQLLAEVFKLAQEVVVPQVCKGAVASVEHFLQLGIVKNEKLVHGQSRGLYEGEPVVDCLLVDAKLFRYECLLLI